MKTVIYWTCDKDARRRIKLRFGIKAGMQFNGETVCEIAEKDYPVLLECQNRKFLKIRNKPWAELTPA